MSRRAVSLLFAIASLACAKPGAEQASSGGDGGEQLLADPPAGSCAPSRVREVRYGSAVGKQVDLPIDIANLRCVEDFAALEPDIACARAFNQAGLDRALAEAGLEWIDYEEFYGELGYGEVGRVELGAALPDPDDPQQRLLFLGHANDPCDGVSVHAPAGPGVRPARNRAGEIVVVVPNPTVEERSYRRCSCFPGCGAMPASEGRYARVPADAPLGQPVALEYPAIAITSRPVENTTCCCAP